MRNQIDATALSLVEALNQRDSDGVRLDLTQQLFAKVGNKLVGHNED